MIRVRIEATIGEAPASFWLGQRLVRVRSPLDRWFGEDHAYYKVLSEDGTTYILRHDLERDEWELTLMDGLVAQRPP